MAYSIETYKSLISLERGLASANLYRVSLPSLEGKEKKPQRFGDRGAEIIKGYNPEFINILCKGTSLPGRQIMTLERNIGMTQTKIAHGYAVTGLTLNFSLTNAYFLRKYFQDWQELAISNTPPFQAGYYEDYALPVKIQQLRKGESFNFINANFGSGIRIPQVVRDALPTIGSIDLGDLSQGDLKIALTSKENVVYECTLLESFPTTMSDIALSNDADILSEFSVELSFKNWEAEIPGQKRTIADKVTDAVNDVIGAIVGVVF